MKITIIFDNTSYRKELKADWGFSCLIEAHGRKILFDTGADGKILLQNLKNLKINLSDLSEIFISHIHRDHTGGLAELVKHQIFTIYVPHSCKQLPVGNSKLILIDVAQKLHKNFFSTGELKNIEHSLAVKTEKGLAVIVGCSHPSVESILQAASFFGEPKALIGGLHGFNNFMILKNLVLICPTHCTQYIQEIKDLYPKQFIEGGAGKIIRF